MRIQLSEEEAARIQKYRTRLIAVGEQINILMASGDEIKDVLNTAWRDAYRRMQLSDEEFSKLFTDGQIPPMIDDIGQQIVSFNPKTKMASWESIHDGKRVAKSELKVEPEESQVTNDQIDTEESCLSADRNA